MCAGLNSDDICQREIKVKAGISGSQCHPKCDEETKRRDL